MSMLCKRVIRCFHEHVKLWQQTYTSCSQKVQKLLLLHTHWPNLRVKDHCWWWACSQKLKSSLDWKSLQSLPWELVRSTSKSIIFFDIHRIVHCEFVLQAVKAELHCNILKRLRENIRYTQPELWCMSIIAYVCIMYVNVNINIHIKNVFIIVTFLRRVAFHHNVWANG